MTDLSIYLAGLRGSIHEGRRRKGEYDHSGMRRPPNPSKEGGWGRNTKGVEFFDDKGDYYVKPYDGGAMYLYISAPPSPRFKKLAGLIVDLKDGADRPMRYGDYWEKGIKPGWAKVPKNRVPRKVVRSFRDWL